MKAWEIRVGELSLHEVESVHPREGETMVRISHTGICGQRSTEIGASKRFRPSRAVATWPRDCWHGPDRPRCRRRPARAVRHLSALRRQEHPPLLRSAATWWDLPGGLAEQVVVPAANAHQLPDGLDRLHAVLADPTAVAIHGLRCNPVGSPGRLAVVGAGTVGLLTALYAHQQDWEVTVVHRDRRARHSTVADTVPAAFRSSAALHMDETFDVVVDAATGADPTPIDLALRLVDDGGTVVVQNAYHPGVRLPTPLRDLFRRSIRVIGSFSHCRRQRQDDFALALDLLHEHAPQVANLVAEAGQLADLPAVLGGRSTCAVRQVLAVRTS